LGSPPCGLDHRHRHLEGRALGAHVAEMRRPGVRLPGQELTLEQHVANQALTHRRLQIGHVNNSVKRCRIVKDRLRLWKDGIRDLVMEICCALHNLRVRLTNT
jgi:DDE superfamily endonuclease